MNLLIFIFVSLFNVVYTALIDLPSLPIEKILDNVSPATRLHFYSTSKSNKLTAFHSIKDIHYLRKCGFEALKMVNPGLARILSLMKSSNNIDYSDPDTLNTAKLSTLCLNYLITANVWKHPTVKSVSFDFPKDWTADHSKRISYTLVKLSQKIIDIPTLEKVTIHDRILQDSLFSSLSEFKLILQELSRALIKEIEFMNGASLFTHNIVFPSNLTAKIRGLNLHFHTPPAFQSYPLMDQIVSQFPHLTCLDIGPSFVDFTDVRTSPFVSKFTHFASGDPYTSVAPGGNFYSLKSLKIYGDVEYRIMKVFESRYGDHSPYPLEELIITEISEPSYAVHAFHYLPKLKKLDLTFSIQHFNALKCHFYILNPLLKANTVLQDLRLDLGHVYDPELSFLKYATHIRKLDLKTDIRVCRKHNSTSMKLKVTEETPQIMYNECNFALILDYVSTAPFLEDVRIQNVGSRSLDPEDWMYAFEVFVDVVKSRLTSLFDVDMKPIRSVGFYMTVNGGMFAKGEALGYIKRMHQALDDLRKASASMSFNGMDIDEFINDISHPEFFLSHDFTFGKRNNNLKRTRDVEDA
jgi:hypothetical protein